ncbi:MAG TPA: pyrophosphatase PpaX [Symbiobacteriaceae bacterium]|nr:pyrophosphatase PpaX [Symbiobacteriaceae bacterium]
MPFSVVLFDLDGTVINTNDLIVASFQHVLKENLGLDVPAATIHRHFGEPLPRTMGRYHPERAEELTNLYRVYNLANHDALVKEFEGVRDTLEALRAAGVRLGIVTSKRRDLALRGLRVTNLAPFFETVVGMDDTEKHKPEPEPVLLALERLGRVPGPDVLMVGDSTFDILCGRNAGVKTAAVGWTVIDRLELAGAGPDAWVERPQELLSLVLDK